MKKITFILTLIIFTKISSLNAWALPACPSDPEEIWDNCQGTYTYESGDIYTGEWKNDEKHGQGTYTYESGGIYIGEWKNSEKHGQGEFIYADGYKVSTNNGILAPAEGLFKVVGNKLYYDTENNDRVDQIEFSHTDNLFDILKSNDQIQVLVLNSTGGLVQAAFDMADLIIDAGLDTHTEGTCLSACVTVFLAGKNRSLDLGGKIGFHKGRWVGSDIEDYYNSHKKVEKWADPFEFASWLYEDTQSDVFKEFEYLLERGVKPSFAIKTLRADADGMWKPRRTELISGGILTQ